MLRGNVSTRIKFVSFRNCVQLFFHYLSAILNMLHLTYTNLIN
jgi:hypothetical protein